MYMSICIYTYVCNIYIYIYVCVYVCIYIHTSMSYELRDSFTSLSVHRLRGRL